MDLVWTDTHDDLKGAARKHLEDQYPMHRICELADSADPDPQAWERLVRQGWLDLDLGPAELAVLAEESGRSLHPGPWLTTAAFAMPLLAACGASVQQPTAFADGVGITSATDHGSCWHLRGAMSGVVDASVASVIAVTADTENGPALFTLPTDHPAVEIEKRDGIDTFRSEDVLTLHNAPAALMVEPARTPKALSTARRHAATLLANEAVGVADRALELAVSYAGVRRQFGRPIGSFQAVSHQLAEGYADVELARSLAHRAAHTMSTSPAPDTLDDDIACALHACSSAAVAVCEAAIQIHGGTGVTWEFPLHHWYRRALWIEAFADRYGPLGHLALRLLGPT